MIHIPTPLHNLMELRLLSGSQTKPKHISLRHTNPNLTLVRPAVIQKRQIEEKQKMKGLQAPNGLAPLDLSSARVAQRDCELYHSFHLGVFEIF